MSFRFSVDHWAAWAPGLTTQDDWRAWLGQPVMPALDATPALAEMPAMMRRRVERLGRVALQAAYWGLPGDLPADMPIVFASRYGDVTRSVELLRQLAVRESLSPTAFSMSVHNAIGALFSIARNISAPYTAIASGEETVETAVTEAVGMLADGVPAVLLVYYDEPLPDPYKQFADDIEFPRAWAVQLSPAPDAGISLQAGSAEATCEPADLPADLATLRFLVSDAASHIRTIDGRQWRWQRHA